MKKLILLTPGLIWPAQSLKAVAEGLSLPGLSSLLANATFTAAPPATPDDTLLDTVGAMGCGRARLRALGDGLDHDGVLCADPVHLMFNRDALVLTDGESMAITQPEADALIASVNDTFADIGRFTAAAPARWYLTPHRPLEGHTHALADVVGRRVDAYLPSAPATRRLLNEMQMLLHNHPVNTARQSRGAPEINSVWLWGEGALPQAPALPVTLYADSPLARGLAAWSGARALRCPARFDLAHIDAQAIVVLDYLAAPAMQRDIDSWRDTLAALDADWWQPLQQAVARGDITLRLRLQGDFGSADITCKKPGFWPFRKRGLDWPTFLEKIQKS